MKDLKSASFISWFIGLTAVLTTAFFYTPALDPFNLPKAVFVVAIGFGALVGLFPTLSGFDRRRWIAAIPIFLFLVVMTLSAIAGTDNTRRLLFGAYSRATGLLPYVGLTLIAIALLFAFNAKSYTAIYSSLGIVAGIETIYGLLQLANLDPIKWVNGYNRILGTVGNPNFMSAVLGFSAVAMAGVAASANSPRYLRVLALVVAPIELFLGLKSDSVQGPIITLFGVAIVLVGFLYRKTGKSIWTYGFSAIFAIAVILVLAGVAKIGPFADRLYQYTLGVRSQYWRSAIKMMGNSPVTGVGVDSFGENYRLVRDTTTFKTVGPQVFTNAAHSVPLQIGATLGAITFTLYLTVQLITFFLSLRAIKKAQSNRSLLIGLFATWIAFQAQSLISIDQIGVGVWGWVLTGSLLGASLFETSAQPAVKVAETKNPKDKRKNVTRGASKSAIGVVALMAIVGFVATFGVTWKAAYAQDLTVRSAIATPYSDQDAQSITFRMQNLKVAYGEAPDEPLYKLLIIQEMAKMPGTANDVIKYSKMIASEYPQSWDSQNIAANVMESVGDLQSALKYRSAMFALDPNNWQPWLNYANDLQSVGKTSDAKVAFEKVIQLGPNSPEAETATASLKKLS